MTEGARAAEWTGRRPTIGIVVGEAARAFRRRPLLPIAAAVLASSPVHLARSLAAEVMDEGSPEALALPFVLLGVECVCVGGLAAMVTAAIAPEAASRSAIARVRAMARAWRDTLGVQISSGMRIWIGLCLLMVPGIYESVRLFVAVPAAVIERQPMVLAARRSQHLVRGCSWVVFGLWVLPTLVWLGSRVVTDRLEVPFTGSLFWGALRDVHAHAGTAADGGLPGTASQPRGDRSRRARERVRLRARGRRAAHMLRRYCPPTS